MGANGLRARRLHPPRIGQHGILSRQPTPDPDIATRFPIGTQLRILPNHACATGAQYPDYHLVTAAGATEVWPRFHGW